MKDQTTFEPSTQRESRRFTWSLLLIGIAALMPLPGCSTAERTVRVGADTGEAVAGTVVRGGRYVARGGRYVVRRTVDGAEHGYHAGQRVVRRGGRVATAAYHEARYADRDYRHDRHGRYYIGSNGRRYYVD